MQKFFGKILAVGLGLALFNTGKWIGHWKVWALPAMNPSDLTQSSVSFEDQRKVLIEFDHGICQSFTECSESTHGGDNTTIVKHCQNAAKEISQLRVPASLPQSVAKNLEVYRQSMINSSIKLADSWTVSRSGRAGGSFWTYMTNWEIDTCGPDSIPQKIYRLYKLDELTQSKIVSCQEISRLYNERFPAAVQDSSQQSPVTN
jgi:hypothetical protein